MSNEVVKVLNMELSKENFLRLYHWAQTNPERLEETLKSIAKADGDISDDYRSVAINLENDLAHG